ncbi:MAG TPA: hypothetical protein VLC98_12785 [Phnomibacter sp.]|nr:hypothetical protein [Phnomibacter sp.]
MLLSIIGHLLDYSEVWALFIPLAVWRTHRLQPGWMKPIINYLLVALVFNLACDTLSAIGDYYYVQQKKPPAYVNNIAIYNLHSIARFLLMLQFFVLLKRFSKKWNVYILVAFIVSIIAIELFTSESLFSVSGINGNLFTVEALLSLLLCMAYFLKLIQSDVQHFRYLKDFWVVAGFTTYFVINFFVFLFYNPLFRENQTLASRIWDVHNISYIILSIFISIALYVHPRDNY